jgi:hypothetical protein
MNSITGSLGNSGGREQVTNKDEATATIQNFNWKTDIKFIFENFINKDH